MTVCVSSLFNFCYGMFMSWSSSESTASNQTINKQASLPPVVINTRPIERAAPLTNHLQAAGFSVVDIPILTLEMRPTTEQDMALMRQWFAGDYQALGTESQAKRIEVATSTQQDASFKVLKAPSHLIAVGEATAAVLNDAKLDAANYQVLQPLIANNEGMLAMPEIDSLQAGDRLLVWRGLGGRRLLVNTLQARGVHIDSIAWYERKMPNDARSQYKEWHAQYLSQKSEQPRPIVIVSSGTAFEHWQAIVTEVAAQKANAEKSNRAPLQLNDFAYVVLGERLANMVDSQDLSYWRVEDLAPETIVAAIHTPLVGCS